MADWAQTATQGKFICTSSSQKNPPTYTSPAEFWGERESEGTSDLRIKTVVTMDHVSVVTSRNFHEQANLVCQ